MYDPGKLRWGDDRLLELNREMRSAPQNTRINETEKCCHIIGYFSLSLNNLTLYNMIFGTKVP